MSHHRYHTSPVVSEQLQALNEEGWEQGVLSQLPEDWEGQAYQLQAYVRDREVQGPAQLLRAVLGYVLCGFSFRHLACWAVLIGLPNLSDTAWRKRVQHCHGWLWWILQELLSPSHPVGTIVPISAHIRRVHLIDTTRLKEPGGSGDDYRVHLAYDLLSGRFSQVSLSDCHGAESFSRFRLQAGDVAVGDAGYGYRVCVTYAFKQGAYAIVRICPSTFPLLDENGHPLDVVAWLREKGAGTHGRTVSYEYRGVSYRVRLIAKSLRAEDAQRLREAKIRKASKKGRHLKEETLFLTGWVLLISSVPAGVWSDAEILRLYQARWQIELLFKRMKQLLHLNQLRGKTTRMNEVTILACLICWCLQEQQVVRCRKVLDTLYEPVQPDGFLMQEPAIASPELVCCVEEPPEPGAISEWQLAAVGLQTLRVAVQGYWTASRLELCMPHLLRFFRSSPRQRRHQRQGLLLWLSQQTKEVLDESHLFFNCSGA
jgi:hypothetical protein